MNKKRIMLRVNWNKVDEICLYYEQNGTIVTRDHLIDGWQKVTSIADPLFQLQLFSPFKNATLRAISWRYGDAYTYIEEEYHIVAKEESVWERTIVQKGYSESTGLFCDYEKAGSYQEVDPANFSQAVFSLLLEKQEKEAPKQYRKVL